MRGRRARRRGAGRAAPAASASIAASDFFQGHFTTALDDDECVVEVRMPLDGSVDRDTRSRRSPAGTATSRSSASRPRSRSTPTAGSPTVASALMGVADVPYRARAAEAALVGAEPTAEAFAAAAQTATAGSDAGDVTCTGRRRTARHLAAVTVRRALTTAGARAKERTAHDRQDRSSSPSTVRHGARHGRGPRRPSPTSCARSSSSRARTSGVSTACAARARCSSTANPCARA